MINLEEIKERESKATKGPWVNMGETDLDSPFFGQVWATCEEDCLRTIAVMPEADDRTEDFNFIASAREDIPALVAEIERLRARIDAYDKYVRGYLNLGQLEAALKNAMDW